MTDATRQYARIWFAGFGVGVLVGMLVSGFLW